MKDIDRGAKALTVAAAKMRGKLSVGITESAGGKNYDASGRSLLQVAQDNEFGTAHIPARSFIGGWFDEFVEKNKTIVAKLQAKVMSGALTQEMALHRLGTLFVAQIQNRIASGISPANAPATVARKGSSTPLVDTGFLKSSIEYSIEDV